jgi:hypothetical protein
MQVRALLFLASFAALPAGAQSTTPMPVTAKPAAPVRLPYVSDFADYRPWRDADPLPWAKANQEVGIVGGHAGTLRGAAADTATRKPAPRPASKQ